MLIQTPTPPRGVDDPENKLRRLSKPLVPALEPVTLREMVLMYQSLQKSKKAKQPFERYDVMTERSVIRRLNNDSDSLPVASYPNPVGKRAGDGWPIWGATLLDFYWVGQNRGKGQKNYVLASGSGLADYARCTGNISHGQDVISWADQEASPVEVPVYNIKNLLEEEEIKINLGLSGRPMGRVTIQETTSLARVLNPKCSVFKIPNQETSECSKTQDKSLNGDSADALGTEVAVASEVHHFEDASKLLNPWPVLPFSTRSPRLQQALSRSLLPEKIFVHDPWGTLPADRVSRTGESWPEARDIIQIYNLNLLKKPSSEAISADSTGEPSEIPKDNTETNIWASLSSTHERSYFLQGHGEPQSGLTPPLICVYGPKKPQGPTHVPEAHLYLSPNSFLGNGNHSRVFEAEWELPRSLLVPEVLCDECVLADVKEQMAAAGFLSTDLLLVDISASLHYPGPGEPGDKSVFFPTRNLTLSDGKDALPGLLVVKEEIIPAISLTLEDLKIRGLKNPNREYLAKPAQRVIQYHYGGPVIHITSRVKWQDPHRGAYCSHIRTPGAPLVPPTTARVRVAAKLSRRNDRHLLNEARACEQFEPHLSQHWSGYNIFAPIQDPVPANAVVPNFYGYYTPETPSNSANGYLSPIMLLESCGDQISPPYMSIDDRNECGALLYRLHATKWNQGSFCDRNVLTQAGPLTEHPLLRVKDSSSYRLIDFGRAVYDSVWLRAEDRGDAVRALGH